MALGATLGCASTREVASPREAARRAATALQHDDDGALYDLLPPSERLRWTRAEFAQRMQTRREESRALGAALGGALGTGMGPVAAMGVGRPREALVVEESGGWRVADPGFGPPTGAAVPGGEGVRAVLGGMREALVRRDVGALRALLSARALGSLDAEVDALVRALDDPASLELRTLDGRPSPGRMLVVLPDGRRLELVREGGQWRVEALRDD